MSLNRQELVTLLDKVISLVWAAQVCACSFLYMQPTLTHEMTPPWPAYPTVI
jgi:hypothetical protein